jgi:hypothetical protein
MTTYPVSEGQKSFIRNLLADREVPQTVRDRIFAGAAQMTWHEAKAWITELKLYPWKHDGGNKPAKPEIPAIGVYELDNQFYAIREFTNDDSEKIRYARRAEAVDIDGIVVDIKSPEAHRVDFVKAPGYQYKLANGRRLELSEIEDLSLQFSTCFVCGRVLKVNKSKTKGIGPVCARRVRGGE